jgi:streptomycin 3"-adenylyltransferase
VVDVYWLLERDLHYQAYGVLNMCRVLQYLQTGADSSKDEGGMWGLENLPENYPPVIQAALNHYRNDTPMPDEKGQFQAFADFMLKQIEAAS